MASVAGGGRWRAVTVIQSPGSSDVTASSVSPDTGTVNVMERRGPIAVPATKVAGSSKAADGRRARVAPDHVPNAARVLECARPDHDDGVSGLGSLPALGVRLGRP